MLTFHGLPSEDHNLHIAYFLEICDMFRVNDVPDDTIRLRLFSFSLKDRVREWLNSLLAGSISYWATLAQKFLVKYFSPGKTVKLRNDITNFMQYDQESMYEAWERYKDLLRKCPHHELPGGLQIQIFYNRLRLEHRAMVDATAEGSLMRRTLEEAYGLPDEMALNAFSWNTDRIVRKPAWIHSISTQAALAAQVEALQR